MYINLLHIKILTLIKLNIEYINPHKLLFNVSNRDGDLHFSIAHLHMFAVMSPSGKLNPPECDWTL